MEGPRWAQHLDSGASAGGRPRQWTDDWEARGDRYTRQGADGSAPQKLPMKLLPWYPRRVTGELEPGSILSLFCGAGGLDLGFEAAGFRPILALDKDEASVATYNENRVDKVAFQADLASLSPLDVEQLLPSRVTGVIGGPPCQGFSTGNTSRELDDPRNSLVLVFAEIVRHLNRSNALDFFVLENVAGLLARAHSSRLDELRNALGQAGFNVRVHEANAVAFGVPQTRRRVLLVGLNKTRWPTSELKLPRGKNKARTVRDTIAYLPEPTYFRRDLIPAAISFHPNHWTMRPASKRFATGDFNKWRSFRRLEWDAPSPTVAYGNREIHIHPRGHRRLSVLEAMLLQGFPKTYVLSGNFSQQVTQVSNAVPPRLGFVVASAIRKALSQGRRDSCDHKPVRT